MGMSCQQHSPAALVPRKRASTHCAGSWMGSRVSLKCSGTSHPQPGFDSQDHSTHSDSELCQYIHPLRQLNLVDGIFFQHDGTPCKYTSNVPWLSNVKLISTAGAITWPLRLVWPHWTVFLCHVKTVVYSLKPHSLDELKFRITNAIHETTEQQLKNIFNGLEYRFQWCVLNDGGYAKG
jgi:hypothetical protein